MSLRSFARATLPAVLAAAAGPALAAQTGEALYDVTFEATWSAGTHPGAYPAGAHFSPLIGATHNPGVGFWQPGGIATSGIESMAETGGTATLAGEINAAITAGTAKAVITGSGINSPGSTSTTLRVTPQHSRVTLVTMVAPSPDWFVGVDSLNLLENGVWVDKTVELYAYDAGSDNGVNFNSPNSNTSPKEPIALITGGPFFGTTPLGTFRFVRRSSTLVYGCGVNPEGSLTIVSGNPRVGETVTVGLADPTGTMGLPSGTFLALSLDPGPLFPCGPLVPNWGLFGVGVSGELLVDDIRRILVGPDYAGGAPSTFALNIPNKAAIIGLDLYSQGLLIDPTGRFGLTGSLEIHVGP